MAIITDESPQAGAPPQQQQPNPTQVSQGSQAPSFGTQYIGIGDYLKANQGQGQAMTQNAVGNINQQGQKTKQSISALQQQEIDKWNKEDSDFMTSAISDPSKLDAAGQSRYKELNKKLSNPLTPLDQKANATAAMANTTQMAGMQARGTGNIGKSFLDAAIGVGEGGQSAIQNALSQYSTVDADRQAALQAKTKEQQEADAFRAAELAKVNTAMGNAQTAAQTAENTRKANLANATTQGNDARSTLERIMQPFIDYENTPQYKKLQEYAAKEGPNSDAAIQLERQRQAKQLAQEQMNAQMVNWNAQNLNQYATESPLLAQLRALTGS